MSSSEEITKDNILEKAITIQQVRTQFDEDGVEKLDEYVAEFIGATDDARESDAKDKQMSLLEGIRTYPRAVMWSVILSSCLIMEGYDTKLLSSFYVFPQFIERYGKYNPRENVYEIAAHWQISLSMCGICGEIMGLYIAGWIADRLGYRKTMIIGLFLVTCFIFVLFFAENGETLAAGNVLVGIPFGFFQTLTVSYATEICPTVLRFYLTTYVNLCWVFGQIISAGVIKELSNNTTQWAYRIPFAVQWVYPIPLAIGIWCAPEGTNWLVKKNRLKEAKHSILRLLSKSDKLTDPELVAELMVTKIKITLESEKSSDTGSTYISCFKGTNARRTRIAMLTWVVQAYTGSALSGNAAYFYQKAGLSTSYSFTFLLIQYALGILGTILACIFALKFGRFQIFFAGVSIQLLLLLLMGILGCIDKPGVSWGIGSLMIVFSTVYDIGIGPVTYCLVGEMANTRLRTKAIVIVRNSYNMAIIVNAIWGPYMMNSKKWNWGAKAGIFWAGFSSLFLVWMWFDLPET